MSQRENKNLNSAPIRSHRMKEKTNFHFRGDLKIWGKKEDVQQCNRCRSTFPLTAFTTKYLRADGTWMLKKSCRQCEQSLETEKKAARRSAPPKPEVCDCCHKDKILQMDHLHGTEIFRGWICALDNTGIGQLGDNLEGVLQAAIYLEPDIKKIIETLQRIKNDHLE
tara:strand:+ start:214 stop:714 length:501 start_codon:yes stop_codon:yes gene_type:complete